jgi:hypothetical protein
MRWRSASSQSRCWLAGTLAVVHRPAPRRFHDQPDEVLEEGRLTLGRDSNVGFLGLVELRDAERPLETLDEDSLVVRGRSRASDRR